MNENTESKKKIFNILTHFCLYCLWADKTKLANHQEYCTYSGKVTIRKGRCNRRVYQ